MRRSWAAARSRPIAAVVGLGVLVGLTGVALVGGHSRVPAAGAHPARSARRRRRQAARPGSEQAAIAPSRRPGRVAAPVLMYHVILPPPAGAPFPGLYVPVGEFAAQMHALKAAGWVGVTQDQLRAHWISGAPLPPGKPIVLTFDNGYESQATKALPVLRALHWPAVENLQLTGLPPAQGGLSRAQTRALIAAGWELDTQGIDHADLVTLNAQQLRAQVAGTRTILRRRYGVPVNWFCYPSGHYDPAVVAAVRAAGYVGATTVVPGWARPSSDPDRLPRLRVLGGTSPAALLAQIATARTAPPPPASYAGA